jgi:hypothetical protein
LKELLRLNEVEDLIEVKRTIFNDAFDSKADLELLEGVENFNQRITSKRGCKLTHHQHLKSPLNVF